MHRLYFHIVWTTRLREATIDARVASFLENYVESILVQERAQLLAIGMVQTHVHMLIRAHPSTMLPRLLQRAKGGSAMAATRLALGGADGLRWAKGYSAQTVSWRALGAVREYVLNQERRHPHEAIDGWVPSPRMFQPPTG